MNRKIWFSLAICGMVCFVSALFITYYSAENKEYPRINVSGSQAEYNFEKLQEQAKAIVKVKVLDDASEANAVIEKDAEVGILDFATKRKIRIIDTYKSQLKMSGEMFVLEPSAVYQEQLLCFEGYTPLEKGKEYILYLGNNTKSGDYSVLCGNSGHINEENLENSDSVSEDTIETTVKSLIKYDSELSEDKKDRLLQSEVYLTNKLEDNKKVEIDSLNDNKIQCKLRDKELYVCLER